MLVTGGVVVHVHLTHGRSWLESTPDLVRPVREQTRYVPPRLIGRCPTSCRRRKPLARAAPCGCGKRLLHMKQRSLVGVVGSSSCLFWRRARARTLEIRLLRAVYNTLVEGDEAVQSLERSLLQPRTDSCDPTQHDRN